MKYNRKSFDINAHWTAQEPVEGWRHYRVTDRRKNEEDQCVELMAVCDRTVRFWISIRQLKRDMNWQPGWLP